MKWNNDTEPQKPQANRTRFVSFFFLGHVKMHLAVVRKKTWKTFALHIVLHFSNCQLPARRKPKSNREMKGRKRETNWAGEYTNMYFPLLFLFFCCVLLKIAKSLLPSCSCSPGKCAWNLSSARRAPGNQPRNQTEERRSPIQACETCLRKRPQRIFGYFCFIFEFVPSTSWGCWHPMQSQHGIRLNFDCF